MYMQRQNCLIQLHKCQKYLHLNDCVIILLSSKYTPYLYPYVSHSQHSAHTRVSLVQAQWCTDRCLFSGEFPYPGTLWFGIVICKNPYFIPPLPCSPSKHKKTSRTPKLKLEIVKWAEAGKGTSHCSGVYSLRGCTVCYIKVSADKNHGAVMHLSHLGDEIIILS